MDCVRMTCGPQSFKRRAPRHATCHILVPFGNALMQCAQSAPLKGYSGNSGFVSCGTHLCMAGFDTGVAGWRVASGGS